MAFYLYAIGAGWNVAAGSLVNIESLTPPGDIRAFAPPHALGTHLFGKYETRGDGSIYLNGYATQKWLFDAMTRLQYEYLSSTFCNSSVSGKVTINTRLGKTAYTRVNAMMILPNPADFDYMFYAGRKVPIAMTRLVASS